MQKFIDKTIKPVLIKGEPELKSRENRRIFLKKIVIGSVTMATFGLTSCSKEQLSPRQISIKNPKKGLVLWYSQTGHTARIGRLIKHAWQQKNLEVDGSDYRSFDLNTIKNYDLIAIGSPVQYMDVPVNLQTWMESIPMIEGIPVTAFVTYGGHGDGQHHTACDLLEYMATKGGVPIGFSLFGHMSTFAPTWSAMGNPERILAFKDHPNNDTYKQALQFADLMLEKVSSGEAFVIDREFGMDTLMRVLPQISLTKLLITDHHIDTETCIQCGTCLDKCPMDVIDLDTGEIETNRCIACLGCINNCPVQAVQMKYMGKEVYGYKVFLKRNQIRILKPTLS
jgi:ferredoxin/flavodoxin